jgi:hypothetical protein
MLKRLMAIAALTVMIAAAKSYTFTLTDSAKAGSVDLKAGEYSLKVDGPQVVLIDQKGNRISATAKVETADQKFEHTSVTTTKSDGSNRIVFVGIGGTRNRIIFE